MVMASGTPVILAPPADHSRGVVLSVALPFALPLPLPFALPFALAFALPLLLLLPLPFDEGPVRTIGPTGLDAPSPPAVGLALGRRTGQAVAIPRAPRTNFL